MRRLFLLLIPLTVAALAIACGSNAGAIETAATPTTLPTATESPPTPVPPSPALPAPTEAPSTPVPAPAIIARPAATSTPLPVVNDNGGQQLPPCCKPLVTPPAVFPTAAGTNPSTIASPPAGSTQPNLVPAPIESLAVQPSPGGYALSVRAGLPSGCAKQASHDVSRQGNVITVSVLNSMPAGQVACTMIYGIYSLTIDLPGPFIAGQTYSVRVNDKTTTFTPQ